MFFASLQSGAAHGIRPDALPRAGNANPPAGVRRGDRIAGVGPGARRDRIPGFAENAPGAPAVRLAETRPRPARHAPWNACATPRHPGFASAVVWMHGGAFPIATWHAAIAPIATPEACHAPAVRLAETRPRPARHAPWKACATPRHPGFASAVDWSTEALSPSQHGALPNQTTARLSPACAFPLRAMAVQTLLPARPARSSTRRRRPAPERAMAGRFPTARRPPAKCRIFAFPLDIRV